MNSTYKRLGDYIKPVDNKNTNLITTDLRGVNYQKYFMPSVANTVRVDLSKYKLIVKGQFACNLMHVGRDECLPVALHREENPIIVSPAYYSFEVKDHSKILDEYLFLVFKRKEFDREAWFYTDADVRSGLIKSAFLDMKIPVPSIEEQRRIVAEYQAIEHRIENNRQLIAKLEETAQTIYRKMFVDDIDTENLPNGWHMKKFTNLFNLGGGGTPSTSMDKYWNGNISLFSPADVKSDFLVSKTERMITEAGLNACNSPLYPIYTTFLTVRGTVGKIGMNMVPMAMNQSCYALSCKIVYSPFFTYCSARHFVAILKHQAVGAVFNALVTRDFEIIDFLIPSSDAINQFESKVAKIFVTIINTKKEVELELEILDLLLTNLSINQ